MNREGERASTGVALRRGRDLLGTVAIDREGHGSFAGVLTPGPDFGHYQSLFERAFTLQRRVDQATDAEYQAAWYDWRQSLEAIERLGLTFGEESIPVEGFEVDDSWQVTFRAAPWWVAPPEGGSDA